MKNTDTKMQFIRLRAEGKSYRAIEQEIGVSKSTCGEWERELSADIARLKKETLEEIYTQYGMTKEARIKRIGDTLSRIDDALQEVDFTKIAPERLLDFKLKFSAALRDEYTASGSADTTGAAEDTLIAIQDLYRRISSGETTQAQAKTEISILEHMVTGYARLHPYSDLFNGIS